MKLHRKYTPALLGVSVALAFPLAVGCSEETVGEGIDAFKGQETTFVTSAQVANVRGQENADPGLKAALTTGYEPVAFVDDTEGSKPTYLIFKVCDGAPAKDCMNNGLDSAHPNVLLYVSSTPKQDKVVFEGGYALNYPTPGTSGRGDGVRCEAKTESGAASGLTEGVVGDFVAIGKQVDKTFADAANGAEKVIQLGNADLNCTANLV